MSRCQRQLCGVWCVPPPRSVRVHALFAALRWTRVIQRNPLRQSATRETEGPVLTGTPTNSATEYDFVGGDFDAVLVEYRPKSPKIACFRLESRAVRRKIFAKSGSFWSTPWDY